MIKVVSLQDSFGFRENVTPRVTTGTAVLVIDRTWRHAEQVFICGEEDFLASRFWAAGT